MYIDGSNYIPPVIPLRIDNGEKDPEQMTDYEKDASGVEETFDTESATFMERSEAQPVPVRQQRSYGENQTGCGAKFTSEGRKGCER